MPPAQAYALSKACTLIQQGQWRREKLQELSELLAERIGPEVELVVTTTPIKPLIIGDSDRAVSASLALKERGIWVSAIRPANRTGQQCSPAYNIDGSTQSI